MKELMIDFAEFQPIFGDYLYADINHLRQIQDLAELKYNINLKLMPYSRIGSYFTGGRNSSLDAQEFIDHTLDYNQFRISNNLVLNGGITLDNVPDKFYLSQLNELFEFLSSQNKQSGLENSVTITHPDLFNFVKENYPNVKTIASCLQELDPLHLSTILERLEKYDYVVPINQHTTFESLSQFSNPEKMILFLTLPCGNSDMFKCYSHYAEIKNDLLFGETRKIFSKKDFLSIKPQLKSSFQTNYFCQKDRNYDNCNEGSYDINSALINRPEDLSKLIKMGINKFKVPNMYPISENQFDTLLKIFSDSYS